MKLDKLDQALLGFDVDIAEIVEQQDFIPDYRCPHSCSDGNSNRPCAICNGRGWYAYGGDIVRCPNYVAANDKQRQQYLSSKSKLDSTKTFDSFDTEPKGSHSEYTNYDKNVLKSVKRSARHYVESPSGWFVLQGRPGCGKTHLAHAIGLRLQEGNGYEVQFTTGADLLDSIRASFEGSPGDSEHEIIQHAQNVDLLILDDYGAESPTVWAREKLFQLLNHRHSNRKPTVITTNLDLNEMPPRIRSRMQERAVVTFIRVNAPDYRASTSDIKSERHKNESVLRKTGMTFDTWWADRSNSSTNRAREIAESWSKNPYTVPFLYIVGNYGVGKTYLAQAIANALGNKSSIEFITISDLSQKIHSIFSSNEESGLDSIIERYSDCDYLFLDDLDIKGRRFSQWSMSIMFDIVDKRVLHGRPTVITSPVRVSKLPTRWRSKLETSERCYELIIGGGDD